MHDRVFKHTEAHKLEDPQRLRWIPPATILAKLRLSPGMKIADIGSGPDTSPFHLRMPWLPAVMCLRSICNRRCSISCAKSWRKPTTPKNISLHTGDASLLPLQDRSVDLVFYANIWHEIARLDLAIREASRVAVADGKIAILDWREDCVPPPGPPSDHRISANRVVTFLGENGCEQVASTHIAEFSYLVTATLKSDAK